MSETIIVNSLRSKIAAKNLLDSEFDKHKYLKVTLKPGIDRTDAQNRLQRKWMLEAEAQGDMTAEEYRGYCKLHFGCPIRCAEEEDFNEMYEILIQPMTYENKLKAMMIPCDVAVTRDMSRNQKTRYLNLVREHFEGLGFRLTIPKDKKILEAV